MAGPERTTVYVADDHPVFLEAVGRAISTRTEFELVGHAADGRRALEEIRELRPQIAVLDLYLPSLSGVEILREIVRAGVPTRVVILSGEEAGALVLESVQLGAAGYLTKASTLSEICDAVASVARGAAVISPHVQSGLMAELRERSQPASLLSPREAAVLRLVAAGHSAPEIGRELFISASTVKTHIKGVFEKFGVSDRAAAVAEGMRRGLLE